MKLCRLRPLSERHWQPPATGHRDQDTNLFIEAEFIDAKTNETMAKVVREVFGSQLENECQQITAKGFKAAIYKLNTDLWTFIHS